jgi:hypothetical protein
MATMMMMVSCRKGFWSATDFASSEQFREVDLHSGASTVISAPQFVDTLRNKRVVVLVHGYNNEELDVIASYRAIDERMRLLGFLGGASATYDALIGFAWPGGAVGFSFPFARQRAGQSAPRLRALLAKLRGAGATGDLNTHSLGSHVAFEALRLGTPGMVRYAWNFASAVDNESIEHNERYYDATKRCERFYVFHSKRDPVLRVWYRLGDFFEFDTALGYSGPEDAGAILKHSANVRVINCKDVVHSHSGYRGAGEVWSYMRDELTVPSPDQFVTITRTDEAVDAVFRLSHGAATAPAQSPKKGRRRSVRRLPQ